MCVCVRQVKILGQYECLISQAYVSLLPQVSSDPWQMRVCYHRVMTVSYRRECVTTGTCECVMCHCVFTSTQALLMLSQAPVIRTPLVNTAIRVSLTFHVCICVCMCVCVCVFHDCTQTVHDRLDNTPGVNMSWKDLATIVQNVIKATHSRRDDSSRCVSLRLLSSLVCFLILAVAISMRIYALSWLRMNAGYA
jgi:hypothetical protein